MESERLMLITIDGKPVYDCGHCWVIRDKLTMEPEEWKVLSNVYGYYKDKGYLFFSTEQAANEYKFWNQPIYSRNDLKNGKV